MKRYLLRTRLIVISAVCMFISLAIFASGIIFLWLDTLDPPDNPLPPSVLFLERVADFLMVPGFSPRATLYVSAVWAALLGVIVAVIIDVLITSASRIVRRQTI